VVMQPPKCSTMLRNEIVLGAAVALLLASRRLFVRGVSRRRPHSFEGGLPIPAASRPLFFRKAPAPQGCEVPAG